MPWEIKPALLYVLSFRNESRLFFSHVRLPFGRYLIDPMSLELLGSFLDLFVNVNFWSLKVG